MSEIERIPSMHKKARPITPKKGPRQPRQMAQPAPQAEPESQLAPDPEPQPEPFFEPQPAPEPVPMPVVASEPAAQPAPESEPVPEPAPEPQPVTMRELLRRVDGAWDEFRTAAVRLPAERMDEHLGDGWTRKQMLAHVAAWHDLTADQLVKLALTGRPAPVERDVDAINASVARQAIGKTAGEVLKDVESTFNRLRRQMLRLSDAQLRLRDAWAAQVIADNTYEHYAEHMADLYVPPPVEGSTQRR